MRLSWLPRVEHPARDRAGGHGSGPARVEREVRDDLADLLARDAVGQRALQVPGKLIGPVHGSERRDRDQAAVALGESGPFPDVAEEDLLAELDELGGDLSDHVAGG